MAGIYIHIEASLCEGEYSRKEIKRYAQALADELSYYAGSNASNETIESIYIGGCTHCMPEPQHRIVLESLFSSFDTVNLQEITLEVTPGVLTRDAFRGFLALGVTQIQVLAGSFFDDDLERLELPFASHQISDTIEQARTAGIEHIGVDLCLDTPDQPYEYWGANLQKVAHWDIEHVVFHRRPPGNKSWPQPHNRYYGCSPLAQREQERHELAIQYLQQAGYEHYLWMEFAHPGRERTQSQLYVQHANILGVGAGAHSFWWHGSSHSQAARWANVEEPARYIGLLAHRNLPVDAKSWFHLDALGDEFVMLQLPTTEGLDLALLESHYGIDLLSDKIETLAWLESQQWIEPIRNNRVRLTPLGQLNYPHIYQNLINHPS